MHHASFTPADLTVISRRCADIAVLIENQMREDFGDGIKSVMASVLAAGMLAVGACNDDCPAAIQDGISTFNLAMEACGFPFALVPVQ
jgi:hypothetical protein